MTGPANTPTADSRIWVGRLDEGHDAEHEAFVEWLQSDEAADLFRRRRLSEYRLVQDGRDLVVLLRAPHTGDPRLMIDVLRYPGLWPDYWLFSRGGPLTDADELALSQGETRVHWRRDEAEA